MVKRIANAKRGPKTAALKVQTDVKLRQLYDQDGITPWRASQIAQCGYEYAQKKFKEFADQIATQENEDWIEKNDRVRARALEGIAVKIGEVEVNLERIQEQIKEAKHMQRTGLDETESELQNTEVYKMVKDYLDHMDSKLFMIMITVLRKSLDQHKAYGFLLSGLAQQERASITLKAELQQQYDAIEILPPPSAVLEAELEKRIAAKQGLFKPAVPTAEQQVKKK